MDEKEWLILNYSLSKEPSRVRVSVWRKLKKYGSISIGQSMWLLPMSKEHLEVFTEISQEILQNKGEAYVMKAVFLSVGNSNEIIQAFNKVRDEEYKELLDKCEDFFREIEKETERKNFTFVEVEENEDEYHKMLEWYKKISARDFFGALLQVKANQELEKCKEVLENFSNKVYEING